MKKLVMLVLMNICVLLFPATFDAHADLSSSMPADGAVLTSIPSEVKLNFSTVIDG
ncbi:copper resistance protein CopC, partial [Leptospira santarosai]|nr:copper resistance protein CopC [Leptospira santarosai]